MSLFTFDEQFFCLSAAQNAPPAGGQPAGGAFCASDKQNNFASKVNNLMHRLENDFRELEGYVLSLVNNEEADGLIPYVMMSAKLSSCEVTKNMINFALVWRV